MTQGRHRPTLRDIADATGLSPAAVSYALRGLQVTEETQARVREAAQRLGYQADPIARALASGRTETVGVLCGSLADGWQQQVAAALGRGLLGAGRNPVTVDAGNDPAREITLAKRMVDQRVDALIVLPVDPNAPHWAETADRTVLVAVGDGLPGAPAAAEVVFDNATGVSHGLRLLAAAGHTRVTLLTPTHRATPDRPAEQIVQQVAPDLGLTAVVRSCPHDLDGAAAVVRDLLKTPDPPTAFFCLADSIAFGVYLAARELGLAVPQDVSVVGYDDLPAGRLLTPPLSSYHWPVESLVEAVVSHAVEAIDKKAVRPRRTVLTPEPMPRGSVAPPRAAVHAPRETGRPGP
ncbi:LacI family DNA-binding transcriptional regulator [Kineosporia sp. J2-2]|uniref:LacI family DNA-binding transcriptional regulator n=1 Tax=Kineosporia corallincola TaxID=2835133 RepID=A0ABS5T8L7_9ACTN|nr:LacI family DNA-binding transcriptional regulator [Kineosporia corallincola]MBT0767416.1 LacI family DNA-binding transcriptional regulator [Kineosporia corallincola]